VAVLVYFFFFLVFLSCFPLQLQIDSTSILSVPISEKSSLDESTIAVDRTGIPPRPEKIF